MKPRWLLEGLGASILVFFPYFVQLVLPAHIAVYRHKLPISNLVGGLLLDLALVCVVSASLIAVVYRLRPLPRDAVSAAVAGLALWRILAIVVLLQSFWHSVNKPEVPQSLAPMWSRIARPLALLLFGVPALWAYFQPQFTKRFVQAMRVIVAGLAFSSFWILPQLLHLAFASPPQTALQSVVQPAPQGRGRVIWILFDELSFDLVFDHVPSGLQFPNFARLKSQSVSFNKVKPVGLFTDRIVLSLVTGFAITQIRSTLDGQVSYLDTATRKWREYDPQTSLFGLATKQKWNPAISGWYNPYCRIFSSVLSACSCKPGVWEMLPTELNGGSQQKSAFANAMIPITTLFNRLRKHGDHGGTLLSHNIQDYRDVMTYSERLIGDNDLHFVFLHLPVPHPPGIYDRSTHSLTEGGTYIDNLVLADDTLGTLLHDINDTTEASKTMVIVSSDHSWRVPFWRQGIWTDEEENISKGRFEQRPVLLIHFPKQTSGSEITAPVSELIEHDIIQKMLLNQVTSPDELTTFVAQHGADNLPVQNSNHDLETGQ